MNKLIIPDVQPDRLNLEPYNRRVEEIAKIVEGLSKATRLTEEVLCKLANDPPKKGLVEKRKETTFIIPELLVSKRFHTRKTNTLTTYIFAIARKMHWNFIVIAPSLNALDARIREQFDEVINW